MKTLDVSSLEAIAAQIKDHCCCDLGKTRTHGVPGEGSAEAEIMFVGEAPGFHEDQQARPFVGNAGKFLDEMLTSIGLNRSDVFITNIVKCRPPDNRDPEDAEKQACHGYLEGQINLINPKLIICLGRHSMNYFLPNLKISAVHGQPKRRAQRVVLPLYHPAAALHNGGLRQTLLDDFAKIPAILKKIEIDQISAQSVQPIIESKQKSNGDDAAQLPLL